MAQHVGMRLEAQLGRFACTLHHPGKACHLERRAALRGDGIIESLASQWRGVRVFTEPRAFSFKSDKSDKPVLSSSCRLVYIYRPIADADNERRTGEVHEAHNALVPNDAPLDAIIDHVLPPFVAVTAHGVLG
jgi:hypothetical protein